MILSEKLFCPKIRLETDVFPAAMLKLGFNPHGFCPQLGPEEGLGKTLAASRGKK